MAHVGQKLALRVWGVTRLPAHRLEFARALVDQLLSKGAADAKEDDPRYFADMIAYMDLLVGRLVAKLEELGLREDTLVVFLGDNGTHRSLTSRLTDGTVIRGGKSQTTDAGTRVPMIASWPAAIPAGVVSEALVDFSDFVPTLHAMTGFEPKSDRVLDGVNLLPVFRGEAPTAREWSYCWYSRDGEASEAAIFARTTRYKLYADGRFFDVAQDPREQSPLPKVAIDDDLREVRAMLQDVIDRYAAVERTR